MDIKREEKKENSIEKKNPVEKSRGFQRGLEACLRLRVPAEGSRRLFMALMISNVALFMTGIGVLACATEAWSILGSDGGFFSSSYLVIGLSLIILSILIYFRLGR